MQDRTVSLAKLLHRILTLSVEVRDTLRLNLQLNFQLIFFMLIPIVVVGAGVVGLTTALQLKRSDPSLDITVVAHFLPGDDHISYTSPYAGANWHSFAGKNDKRLQDLDVVGYYEFLKLADDPSSGVWRKPNVTYQTPKALASVNGDTSLFKEWFHDIANTRILGKDELRPGTVYGESFDGVVISVPVYLGYLVQKCLGLGIKIRRVPAIKDISEARNLHSSGETARLVVNCTGLLATKIKGFTDPQRNFPVRGQVVVLRNNVENVITVDGHDDPNESLYIFPRKEGGCIVGGSFFADNWDSTEDRGLTDRILQRALRYVPELVDPNFRNNPSYLDIVKVNVGLRPFRDGQVRIEIDDSKPWLIHNYGAGGGGYQGSYGFAAQVVKLAEAALSRAKL